MASGVDLLFLMNASCAQCGDLGPPPDSILFIPPPPLPAFLQRAPPPPPPSAADAAPDAFAAAAAAGEALLAVVVTGVNASLAGACSAQCEWGATPGVEYVELTRQGPSVDDTWLLVLIASCAGVLLLGTLLALLLIKCRVQRAGKTGLQLEPAAALGKGGCEAVLYPSAPSTAAAVAPDSRVLWAALTPRGTTRHYAASAVAPRCAAAAVPPAGPPPPPPPPPPRCTSFDNTGFVASDEASAGTGATTPGAEAYPLSERSSPGPPRPRVSSPTRIEHPNLPPLNLLPGHSRTLRRPHGAAPASAPAPAPVAATPPAPVAL